MYSYDFPRPALSVDLVAFSIQEDHLNILLVKRTATPFAGKWTLPGGFVHDSESLEYSATRILNDKAKIENVYVEQLYTFAAVKRDPRDRVISVAYFAILTPDYSYDGPGSWHRAEQLPSLGFDHNEIAQVAVDRLRSKLGYSDLALEFMRESFTLGELQHTWEIILNSPLDKRNFRKGILKKNLVAETGSKSTGGAHPPAKLYKRL